MSKFNPYPSWKCCGRDQSPLFTTCKMCQKKNPDLKLVNNDWECKDCHMINFKSKECQSRTCKERRFKTQEQLETNNTKLTQEFNFLKETISKMNKTIESNRSSFDLQIRQLTTLVKDQENQIANLKTQLKKREHPDPPSAKSPIFGGYGSMFSSKSYSTPSSSNYIKESEMTSMFDHPKYSGKSWADESYAFTAENGY